MKQVIMHVLENYPIIVYFAVLFFAFVPGTCIARIWKLRRWIKTVAVLVFGELGAVALWILSHVANDFGADHFLADFKVFAISIAILFLIYAIVGHVLNWDHRMLRGLKKEE